MTGYIRKVRVFFGGVLEIWGLAVFFLADSWPWAPLIALDPWDNTGQRVLPRP